MYCSRCGHAAPDGAASCPSCGASLHPTTPAQAIAAGQVREEDVLREALGSEYALVEELGRGGMAIVYRAEERALSRDVAVKLLPFHLAFDQDFVARFEREARTAAALEHPNIIPIYRVGKAGQVPFFVMKLLRGGSLAHRIGGGRRLPPAEIRRMLVEAGRALGHASQRGVVHRDIKPDNIMFDEFGTTVLTDFGIAMAASGRRLTGTGMSIGTPQYMSPEQARAQPLDGRSDIYSLGIVAYEALTGQVPFDGEDSFAIGYRHITEPLPEPVLEGGEARRLWDVIRRMAEKDPRRRYQDAEALVGALEGRPAPPAEPPPPAPVTAPLPANELPGPRRPVARRPRHHERSSRVLPWALALVLLLAAGGSAGWYFLRGPGAARWQAAPDSTLQPIDTSSVPMMGDTAPGGRGTPGIRAGTVEPGQDSAAVPPASDPLTPDSLVTPPPRDSGAIRIRGLPRGSTVQIDEVTATQAVTRLTVGRHAIGIVAPEYQPFRDTVTIAVGDTLVYEPRLVRHLEPRDGTQPTPVRRTERCDRPGPDYNRDNACYDQRPKALEPTYVALPAGVSRRGLVEAVLWVRVSTEGRVVATQLQRTSGDGRYDAAADQVARTTPWQPATRSGQAVAGWTQWIFPPMVE